MVKKAVGSWQPCGDFHHLNTATVPDTYRISNTMDFTARLASSKVFFKINLRKGYHQIPMNTKDIPKMAISTPFGLFEFMHMTFNMRNMGHTFQHLMDSKPAGHDNSFAYLDDILVHSRTKEEHRGHMKEVFNRLRKADLATNANKCLFGITKPATSSSAGSRPMAPPSAAANPLDFIFFLLPFLSLFPVVFSYLDLRSEDQRSRGSDVADQHY